MTRILPGTLSTPVAPAQRPQATAPTGTAFAQKLNAAQSPVTSAPAAQTAQTNGALANLPTDRPPTHDEIRAAMREAVLNLGMAMGNSIRSLNTGAKIDPA